VTPCATLGADIRKDLFTRKPFASRELGVAILDGLADVAKARLTPLVRRH
jgi:hypothetical protein